MQITVKLFGAVREAAGAKELSLELAAGARPADIWHRLVSEYPVVEPFGTRLAVAVNLEVSDLDAELQDGDEVAFLPPVSGGSPMCSLSETPIDVGSVVARVAGPGMGGIVTFIGAVRDNARGREIRHLEYESLPRNGRTRDGENRVRRFEALAGYAGGDRTPGGAPGNRRSGGRCRRSCTPSRRSVFRLSVRDRHVERNRTDLEEGSCHRR